MADSEGLTESLIEMLVWDTSMISEVLSTVWQCGFTGAEVLRAVTLGEIAYFLHHDLMVLGVAHGADPFEVWPGSPGEWISRLVDEWDEVVAAVLGWVWFEPTPRLEQFAAEVVLVDHDAPPGPGTDIVVTVARDGAPMGDLILAKVAVGRIGLGEVLDVLRGFGFVSPGALRDGVVGELAVLLTGAHIRLGSLEDATFVPWELSPGGSVLRVVELWEQGEWLSVVVEAM